MVEGLQQIRVERKFRDEVYAVRVIVHQLRQLLMLTVLLCPTVLDQQFLDTTLDTLRQIQLVREVERFVLNYLLYHVNKGLGFRLTTR